MIAGVYRHLTSALRSAAIKLLLGIRIYALNSPRRGTIKYESGTSDPKVVDLGPKLQLQAKMIK